MMLGLRKCVLPPGTRVRLSREALLAIDDSLIR